MIMIMKFAVFDVLLLSSVVYSLGEDLLNEIDENVQFYLYTRKNPDEGIKLDDVNMEQINGNAPLKVVVHGWRGNIKNKCLKDMTDEYLKKGDYNVIRVSWSELAFKPYYVAANNTNLAGAAVGRFLTNLHQNYELSLGNVHLIGFSLGAHVCGTAGKLVLNLTGLRISRISALDPAAPLFEPETYITNQLLKQAEVGPAANRPVLINRSLEKTDADVVDVIHTDICTVGYKRRLGTADFYPNGGMFQPSCVSCVSHSTVRVEGIAQCFFCNHETGCSYFIDSINNQKFVSTKCNSWETYKSGRCNNNLKTLMGDGYTYFREATGQFYLRTDSNGLLV